MEIRDVIHGSIAIDTPELAIVDSRLFQRLRQIKQLGFSENSFPSATHNRYIHSLGAMATASAAFDRVFLPFKKDAALSPRLLRFRSALRLAALLHDIGHGPLSHTTEFAMPDVRKLEVPLTPRALKPRKATHEDYTLKIILDSPITPLITSLGASMGLKPAHVAHLIDSSVALPDDFYLESIDGVSTDFSPILRQLISSELDSDRMDYLRRDSLQAGVSYGHFDFDWLLGNLTFHLQDGKALLALEHRALFAFEDFLISRFHMFLMVYFHYKSVVYDEMLAEYFASPDCDYELPFDIERYCECNDSHLFSHLAQSQNPWAKRIIEKRPYKMLVELHSGIPATKTARLEQQALLERIKSELDEKKIHSLTATSTSELSKYFRKPGLPIFVHYDNHYSKAADIPLEQCTDLYQRYGEKRSITRMYVSPEDYPSLRSHGRGSPLPYEDPEN